MSRLSYWNSGKKSNNFKFIDRTISQFFGVGGTDVYVHLYEGVYEQQTAGFTPANPSSDMFPTASGIQTIEDVLFLENRDRKYSQVVIPIKGIYNVNDVDFDARQFGLFLSNDTLFIEFHLNDMVATCGRRLIPGDVIELPHQRDDTRPNGLPAINKFYVVQDAMRAADGYSITWYPHIWRIKVDPMPASQEFEDILQQNSTNCLGFASQNSLGDLLSTIGNDLGIQESVVEAAQLNVDKRFLKLDNTTLCVKALLKILLFHGYTQAAETAFLLMGPILSDRDINTQTILLLVITICARISSQRLCLCGQEPDGVCKKSIGEALNGLLLRRCFFPLSIMIRHKPIQTAWLCP